MTRLLCLAIFCAFASSVSAQESTALREIRELRTLVEKQSKQIEVLTEQVARLNQALEHKNAAGSIPVATPAAPAAAAEFSSEAPKAEAPDGKRHVVIKGETLTSIAKHYNITLAELQKANKGVDERKLQIGQTLVIPATTTPEAPTDKKENP
jgi:LysM repeat protein